jgi:SAM-dependent methyltransferase
VGDVSAIAAELVGAGGRVLGFDHDERQVSAATARFGDGAVASFVQATLDDPPESEFDAIVGRPVLMYQPDLVAAVSLLSRRLRPGGVVAFVQLNLRPDGSQVVSRPPTPLEKRVRGWVVQGFESTQHLVGLQLPSIFRRAGLVPQRANRPGPDRHLPVGRDSTAAAGRAPEYRGRPVGAGFERHWLGKPPARSPTADSAVLR